MAAGKVRGHHQILVICQTHRLIHPGLERTRITNDPQSMLDTMHARAVSVDDSTWLRNNCSDGLMA